MYLASNANNFELALSPAAILKDINMARSTYHDQFHILENKGYIKHIKGNTYEFFEKPQPSHDNTTKDFSDGIDFTADGLTIPPVENSVLSQDIEINNSTNTINNWEEKLNGTRYAIFSTSGNNNTFYTIEVDHINVNLIGEVKINTNDRESFKLFYGKYYGSDPVNWNSISLRIVDPFDGTGAPNIQYTGCILFDYDSVVKYLPSIEMGYKWLVSIIDTLNDTSDRFRLMDNKGNNITSFKSLSNMSNRFAAYHQLGLNKGDLNYSGSVTEEDADMLMDYVSMISPLSNLQLYLGDYNNDGYVNIADVIGIRSSLTSMENSYQINKLDERIQQYFLNQEGVDYYEN